ncbi:MAG: hypothetical protein OXU81_18930 [Gammaproteobacteria bacterium]|nr:hypothetical protein [Gammaproteobacteria bacterium]
MRNGRVTFVLEEVSELAPSSGGSQVLHLDHTWAATVHALEGRTVDNVASGMEATPPNGRPNADVLKPWVKGMDLTRRPAGKWIVDFGWDLDEGEAALYEAPFVHVQKHLHPKRQNNRRESYRVHWWRHVEPRQGMWEALRGSRRFIATPTVAKHRLFV